jgi:N-acetylglucosamine-6-phosphate deacetylase
MKSLLLKNARVVFPDAVKEMDILIENGKIIQIYPDIRNADEVIDVDNCLIVPGFIDIHNHGAMGFDVNEADCESLIEIGKFLLSKGITSWLPTLVPDTYENYQRVINAIDELIGLQDELPIARVLGVHYEGVFANEKMCGALRPEYFRSFQNGDEILDLPKLQKGIHLTTLAPEIENGIELIDELIKQNWIVSIGHTRAETEILDQAFRAGAKHITHFYNAMTGLHHRNLGVVGWVLAKNDMTFDIIADGVHVHPQMLKLAIDIKSTEKVILISDSIAPTGLGDGKFQVWNENISVRDGQTSNEKGTIAGSVITLDDARKMIKSIGIPETEVSKMASLNPAKLLGFDDKTGSVAIGKKADLAIFDENGHVKFSMVEGRLLNNIQSKEME